MINYEFLDVNLSNDVSCYNVLVEKYLRQYIFESVNNRRIGIFAGATKPPHKGHYQAALMASEQNDIVYILISNSDRDGITPRVALQIWQLYAQTIPNLSIQIAKSSPVREAYELVDRLNQDPEAAIITVNLYCDQDEMSRYDRIDQYSANLAGVNKIPTPRVCSATQLRAALAEGNRRAVYSFLPNNVKKDQVWNILTKANGGRR